MSTGLGSHLHGGLPGPDTLDPLREGPLVDVAQLEGVTPDLDEVVEERAEAGQGVGGAEEGDVAKLDEHLEVVVKGSLVLGSAAFDFYLAH